MHWRKLARPKRSSLWRSCSETNERSPCRSGSSLCSLYGTAVVAVAEAGDGNRPTSEVRTLAAEALREMSARLNVDSDTNVSTMAVSSESMTSPIDKLLAWVREQGGSDLHVTVDEPPFWRQSGRLVRIDGQKVISAEICRNMVLSTLKPHQRKIFDEAGEVDYCYSILKWVDIERTPLNSAWEPVRPFASFPTFHQHLQICVFRVD